MDGRHRIFMSVDQFERSIRDRPADEKREERIALLREGIETYWEEFYWKRRCRPAFWVQCLLPPLWPILWYRGILSKGTLHAIATALYEHRRRWSHDLADADLSFDGIPDPTHDEPRDP